MRGAAQREYGLGGEWVQEGVAKKLGEGDAGARSPYGGSGAVFGGAEGRAKAPRRKGRAVLWPCGFVRHRRVAAKVWVAGVRRRAVVQGLGGFVAWRAAAEGWDCRHQRRSRCFGRR